MQRARSMSAVATNDAQSFRVPPRYRFQKHLGSGSYGVVAAFHDQERGRDVAIKRVRRVCDNFLVLRRTLREIRLMSHFRHPNLMRLHKVLPLDANEGSLYMTLELMDGDLDNLVHTKRVVLTDQQVRCFTAQILLGLMAMHAGHVIHRDLKPANIFVRLNKGQVKIGDLGLSRGIALNDETGEATHPAEEMLTEYVVTRWYRAPEVLLARAKYGPEVDVWSVGCIVYEMCSRKALFPGKNSYDQLKKILAVLGTPSETDAAWVPRESVPLLQKSCPSGGASSRRSSFQSLCNGVCSSDGADLLQQMCLFNPNLRIGVEQALSHPYLRGITSEHDWKTAKAVDPANVTYDKMFDGVGRTGESAAVVQLARLLRREVAKFNPVRTDTTPERSQADSTPKASITSRTPRGGPQSTAEALVAAAAGDCYGRGNSLSQKAALPATASTPPHQHRSATAGSMERASSAQGRQIPQPELTASVWQRRRSEPEADVWVRRSGQGAVLAAPGRDPTPPPARITRRHPDEKRAAPSGEHANTHAPLALPGAPPASGPLPPTAFWLSETSRDKSPSNLKPHRSSARVECSAGSVPSVRRRIPACSGDSATTGGSTRAPSSRPGTEASTRASSRHVSTSRPRVPSVGPDGEDFYISPALGNAATASPRAGPPACPRGESHGNQDEVHLSARRHHCWLAPEDSADASNLLSARGHGQYQKREDGHSERASQRSLRESAHTSLKYESPRILHPTSSLASLGGVLRETNAMSKNAPDSDPYLGEVKTQERSNQGGTSKTSGRGRLAGRSSSRPTTGTRGHRAAAVGRGADTNDRSPSTRAPHRRHQTRMEHSENRVMSRQRSVDELDFAVSEPFANDTSNAQW